MSARSNVLRLAIFGLLLSRAPRSVRSVLAWMLLGVILAVAVIVFAVTAHAADRFRLSVCMHDESGGNAQCTTASFDSRAKCEQTRRAVGKRLLMPPPIPPMVLQSAGKCERARQAVPGNRILGAMQ
jgi:hypothetical protein